MHGAYQQRVLVSSNAYMGEDEPVPPGSHGFLVSEQEHHLMTETEGKINP